MNKLLVKWLVWRIPVALFWIMILLSMVRVALPDYVPRNIYLAGLPAALIAIIGLVCVGPSHAKYLAWLMAFPLYLCYKLLVILHIHYGSFILALRSITSVFSGFLYFLVLFYTDVSLLNSTDNNLSRHLSLVAIATNYMVIVTSLRWALSPVSILARTSRLLRTIKEDELAKIDKQNTQTTHNAAVTDRKKSLSLELVRSFNDNFLVFVRENIRSLTTFLFIASFGILFVISVANYACMYYSHKSTTPDGFTGLQDTIFSSLLYSVSVATTAPFSGVAVNTHYEQMIYCCELTCTVLLVTMFTSIYSISLGMHQNVIESFQTDIEYFRLWIFSLNSELIASDNTESCVAKLHTESKSPPDTAINRQDTTTNTHSSKPDEGTAKPPANKTKRSRRNR